MHWKRNLVQASMQQVGVMHKGEIEQSLQTVCESALKTKLIHSMVMLV